MPPDPDHIGIEEVDDLPSLLDIANTQSANPIVVEITDADNDLPALVFNYGRAGMWMIASPLEHDDGSYTLAVSIRGFEGVDALYEQTIQIGPLQP